MAATVRALSIVLLASGLARTQLLTAEHTVSGHTRLVRCLGFASGDVLVTGGQDRLVNTWSERGRLLHRVDLRPSGG